MIYDLYRRFARWRLSRVLERRPIPDSLWAQTLIDYPFLTRRSAEDVERLRGMSTLFLSRKEFTGAQGLAVDDAMAVAIAAQACLPVLELGLHWYDGFVGIVVHAGTVLAEREIVDDAGVVHRFDEEVAGEAMPGGPIMLAWSDVAQAADSATFGYNVVIHEFAHVLDMRNGAANGIPPLPDRAAHVEWVRVLSAEYDVLIDRLDAGSATRLDPYAAEGPEEFFAVASESFFVSPQDLHAEHPAMYRLLHKFFQQDPLASNTG